MLIWLNTEMMARVNIVNKKELSKLDYFTLRVLIGLFEYQNGSVVAEQLNTTQPKVSRALSCLREWVKDELFVRQQYGLQPNAMAEKLYPLAKAIVAAYDEMSIVIHHRQPQQSELTIAAQEHQAGLLTEAVQEVCQLLGRNVTINMQQWSDNTPSLIAQGKIDYGVGINVDLHQSIESVDLGEVKYRYIIAKKHHPIFSETLSLPMLFSHRFVFINYSLIGGKRHWLEDLAQKLGVNLAVSLKTSSLNVALDHVVHCDDICWIASALAPQFVRQRPELAMIDVSEFFNRECRDSNRFVPYHYYLQFHHGNDKLFTSHLLANLQDKVTKLHQNCHQQLLETEQG